MPQAPFEDEGGDPPCWAHLFETEPEPPSNATLAQLVCELADAVVIADADGVITFWNDAAKGHTLSIAFTVTLLTVPGRQAPVGVAAVIRDDTERWQQRRQAAQQ